MHSAHSSGEQQISIFGQVAEPEQRTATKAQFADILGMSRGRVSQLIKEGLPTLGNGRIDIKLGKAWYVANTSAAKRKSLVDAPPLTPKGELERIKAELAKLELERELGNIIDKHAAQKAIFERARGERDAWMGWASRAASTLSAELGSDPRETYAILDRIVRDHLADLAETPLKDLANV
ncbi:hypothetical protein PsW64_05288 [Pseudovibrio sp. W64]|uniref:hypothetical protein n=1 Tax=unclassified Pseudovibrio TaxID=2627060 RepID=UPI0007AEDEC1|nr:MULTISPECIES: hypothetical protein [unclassified Pseudovibrio]KZK75384.1 hypothetical protein PsW64_05288 [Pseudovibrio sp. W64]KZK94697.1 hypothetical protein PsAD46_00980 [Pseudovibrio sp. Ad46]